MRIWSIISLFIVLASCKSNRVANNDCTCIEYELYNSFNIRFDGTNQPNGKIPLCFVVGSNEVIPGIEKVVTGMKLNEEKTAKILPEDAFNSTAHFYFNHSGDTVTLVKKDDTLSIQLKVVSINQCVFQQPPQR